MSCLGVRLTLSTLLLALILPSCATTKHEPDKGEYSTGRPDIIRAEAVVTLDSSRRLKGRALILAKKPGFFRIEVRGPLGRLIGLLLSDGEYLRVLADDELKTYRWNDPALPYPFTAVEFVSFLTGGPERDYAPSKPYEITHDSAGKIATLVKFNQGNPILSVEMSDYRTNSGYAIPHNISLKDDRAALVIRYKSVEVNPEIKADVFKILPILPQ